MRAWLPSARSAAARASSAVKPLSRCSSASSSRCLRSSRSRSSVMSHLRTLALSHLAPRTSHLAPSRLYRNCHDTRDGSGDSVPVRLLGGELFPAGDRQSVVLALALLIAERFPFGAHPSLALETMQRRVQRAVLQTQNVVGGPLNVLRDLVAVRRAEEERAQDQHVERPLQEPGTIGAFLRDRHGGQSTLIWVDRLPS